MEVSETLFLSQPSLYILSSQLKRSRSSILGGVGGKIEMGGGRTEDANVTKSCKSSVICAAYTGKTPDERKRGITVAARRTLRGITHTHIRTEPYTPERGSKQHWHTVHTNRNG
ncbi:hypothetical protein EVAR_50872_1 [Eumeta japonica]|uniref:Uncharacterized protein n=1 Tax=Eumeta variegata TaxID=151549 RepID=A0A4C1Y4F1_EUMVA|nr:hypothetical protein EVAR_50872_1 [Eumeta japonica]